jgi:hypothetical protein
MIRTMSPNTTLAVVVSILAVCAAVVLVAAIRAVVEICRVRNGKDRPEQGRVKL